MVLCSFEDASRADPPVLPPAGVWISVAKRADLHAARRAVNESAVAEIEPHMTHLLASGRVGKDENVARDELADRARHFAPGERLLPARAGELDPDLSISILDETGAIEAVL